MPTMSAAARRDASGVIASATGAESDDPYTIGQLAARAGVSAEAIRYYEREGVIPPAQRSGTGKYRRYGTADARRLRFIRRARELGFSLDEVRELLTLSADCSERRCSDIRRVAVAHRDAVDDKLARLAELRGELARIIDNCDGAGPIKECRILNALSDAP